MSINTERQQQLKDRRKLETDRDTKQSTFNDAKKTEDSINHDLDVISREKAVLFKKLEQKTAKKHHMEMTRIDNGNYQEELKSEY